MSGPERLIPIGATPAQKPHPNFSRGEKPCSLSTSFLARNKNVPRIIDMPLLAHHFCQLLIRLRQKLIFRHSAEPLATRLGINRGIIIDLLIG